MLTDDFDFEEVPKMLEHVEEAVVQVKSSLDQIRINYAEDCPRYANAEKEIGEKKPVSSMSAVEQRQVTSVSSPNRMRNQEPPQLMELVDEDCVILSTTVGFFTISGSGACGNDQGGDTSKAVDERIFKLFPQVMEVLCNWNQNAVRGSLKWIDFTSFLNSRLVCKSWAEGLEEAVGIQRKIFLQNGNHRQLDYFMEKVFQRDFSKLFPNSLEIADACNDLYEGQEERSPDVFWRPKRKIDQSLEALGGDIKFFTHRAEELNTYNYISSRHWYITIRNWLLQTPNLECLALIYPQICEKFDLKEELGTAVEEYPFPEFPKLTNFAEGKLPEPVLTCALRANNHIKVLTTLLSCNFKEIELPNLEELTVYVSPSLDKNFLSLTFLNCPLETLNVVFCNEIKPCYINHLLGQFGILQHFRMTLKNVQFNLPVYIKEFSPCPVDIPNLQTLTLDLGGSSRYLGNECEAVVWFEGFLGELLYNFGSLEKLKIMNWKVDAFEWFHVEDPGMFKRKQIRSKFVDWFWELLPSLKLIEIKIFNEVSSNGDFDCQSETFIFIRPIK